MKKLGCFAILVVVLAIPAVAAHYWPLQNVLITLAAVVAVLFFGVPVALSFLTRLSAKQALAEIERQSGLLAQATVEIHRVKVVRAREEWKDEDSPEKARYVLVELTVTPAADANPQTDYWEPSLLRLLLEEGAEDEWADDAGSIDGEPELEATVVELRQLDEAGHESEPPDRVFGAIRLRVVFECPREMKGEVELRVLEATLARVVVPR